LSGFIARGQTSPTMLSRGEFGAVGVERILRLPKRYGIAASFYIPGITIGAWPEHCRRIHEEGHEIGRHGWRHIPPARLARKEEGGLMTCTFHPPVIGRGRRMLFLERLVQDLRRLGAEFVRLDRAAQRCIRLPPTRAPGGGCYSAAAPRSLRRTI